MALWHVRRDRAGRQADPAHNPDINLDIGSPVQVEAWQHDGAARVQYRGAAWDARFVGSGVPGAGRHVIRAIQGNCLLLDRAVA